MQNNAYTATQATAMESKHIPYQLRDDDPRSPCTINLLLNSTTEPTGAIDLKFQRAFIANYVELRQTAVGEKAVYRATYPRSDYLAKIDELKRSRLFCDAFDAKYANGTPQNMAIEVSDYAVFLIFAGVLRGELPHEEDMRTPLIQPYRIGNKQDVRNMFCGNEYEEEIYTVVFRGLVASGLFATDHIFRQKFLYYYQANQISRIIMHEEMKFKHPNRADVVRPQRAADWLSVAIRTIKSETSTGEIGKSCALSAAYLRNYLVFNHANELLSPLKLIADEKFIATFPIKINQNNKWSKFNDANASKLNTMMKVPKISIGEMKEYLNVDELRPLLRITFGEQYANYNLANHVDENICKAVKLTSALYASNAVMDGESNICVVEPGRGYLSNIAANERAREEFTCLISISHEEQNLVAIGGRVGPMEKIIEHAHKSMIAQYIRKLKVPAYAHFPYTTPTVPALITPPVVPAPRSIPVPVEPVPVPVLDWHKLFIPAPNAQNRFVEDIYILSFCNGYDNLQPNEQTAKIAQHYANFPKPRAAPIRTDAADIPEECLHVYPVHKLIGREGVRTKTEFNFSVLDEKYGELLAKIAPNGKFTKEFHFSNIMFHPDPYTPLVQFIMKTAIFMRTCTYPVKGPQHKNFAFILGLIAGAFDEVEFFKIFMHDVEYGRIDEEKKQMYAGLLIDLFNMFGLFGVSQRGRAYEQFNIMATVLRYRYDCDVCESKEFGQIQFANCPLHFGHYIDLEYRRLHHADLISCYSSFEIREKLRDSWTWDADADAPGDEKMKNLEKYISNQQDFTRCEGTKLMIAYTNRKTPLHLRDIPFQCEMVGVDGRIAVGLSYTFNRMNQTD